MPKLLTVCLTPEQQEQLEHVRYTDERPYMRERAAAILKVAEGTSGRQVVLMSSKNEKWFSRTVCEKEHSGNAS